MDQQTQSFSFPFLMQQSNPKIAIAGLGMVGGALAKWFTDAIVYDPPKNIGTKEELNLADIVFVCVPTPYKDGFDLSHVEQVVRELKGKKIVVFKSTILPGTTQKFQEKYPQHKFLFNPEFLTEVSADQDMIYPDRQIIGYTPQSFSLSATILALLPLAPFESIIRSQEAEMVKYFNNTWFFTKVIFANQMYDLCNIMGIEYDKVKNIAGMDKRMTGTSHIEIWHKGGRGVGGKCLPKDTDTLIHWADTHGMDMTLLKTAVACNETLKPNK